MRTNSYGREGWRILCPFAGDQKSSIAVKQETVKQELYYPDSLKYELFRESPDQPLK
jgi:hypothetical protein